MNKPRPAEAAKLDTLLRASRRSARAFSDAIGADVTSVSQWRGGYRPMPAQYAAAAAKYFGIDDPGILSRGYREAAMAVRGNLALQRGESDMGITPDHAMILALRDAVDALRYVLAAMTAVTVTHRPAEARDVARAIRAHLPPELAEREMIQELLKVLDAAGQD